MGSSLALKKKLYSKKGMPKRSKGERLGWASINEYKPIPVRELVGDGSVVNEPIVSSTSAIKIVQ